MAINEERCFGSILQNKKKLFNENAWEFFKDHWRKIFLGLFYKIKI